MLGSRGAERPARDVNLVLYYTFAVLGNAARQIDRVYERKVRGIDFDEWTRDVQRINSAGEQEWGQCVDTS
jgi:hypothetical protein